MAENNNQDNSPSRNPPIYKLVSPKTQAYLTQAHRARLEQEKKARMSANEQT